MHRRYTQQIDILENALEEKEKQLQRYREVVADQACQIASLKEEMLAWRGKVGLEDKEGIVEAMCQVKVERMYRRVRPGIVKINLAVARLANVCERLTEDTAKSEQLLLIPSFSPSVFLVETLRSTLMKPLADTKVHPLRPSLSAEYTAFQRSKRELSPASKPCGDDPLSPRLCEQCMLLARRVDKLQSEVRRHKRFIAGMKGSIEGLVR